MKIGVIVAMSVEYDLVCSQLENKKEIDGLFVEGEVNGKVVILAKSGIGKVCSAVGAVEMIKRFSPDMIVNTGVAGGIDVSLNIGDIVAGEKTVYHDVWCGEGNEYGQVQGYPAYYLGDDKILGIAKSLGVKSGLVCSGDKFITDKNELGEIKSAFPEALAVDMESCSIAQVCYMYKVPFLSLRIISDTPGVDNHAEQYRNFWTEAPKETFKCLSNLLINI